ncbi:transposase protein [Rutstroemia sp. NJR-2017a BVV2]|nr:transposase protein [Rutstroemia sp. NJR-2017a BVV2]
MLPPEERLPEALIWARQHPDDKLAVVARLFKVNYKTLHRHMQAGTDGRTPRGGLNRILSAAQEDAILRWIQDQSNARQYTTKRQIYAAIARLKAEENPYTNPPSWRWFQQWFKSTKSLHTVRTKPISYKRVGAHDLGHIEHWFADYKSGLARYKITTENLYNINETNVRLACLIGQEVIVPAEIAEVYEETPENRRSITVMETICANGTTIHPMVIISGKQHMKSWWELRQPDEGEESYALSESGFTNDQLTMKWFKHFLVQIGREVQLEDTSVLPWKMVLLDNHGSHLQEELILLASRHKIVLWTYISHATHLMQPCDVKYFNQWKYWQQMAIRKSMATLDIEYSIPHFIRDLPWIRSQTNKVDHIKHAFRDAGMWPANIEVVKGNVARFIKAAGPNQLDGIEPEPSLPSIPRTYIDGVIQIEELNRKILALLSSPTRQRYRNAMDGVTSMLYQGDLSTTTLNILREKVNNQRSAKVRSKKVIQVGGELSPAVALAKLKEKRLKEAELEKKKAMKVIDTKLRALHKQLEEDGKAARRQQKANNKEVTELQKAKQPIPEALLIAVYDPSKDQAQLDRIKKVELDWLEAQAEGYSMQEMDMLAQMGDEFELQRD